MRLLICAGGTGGGVYPALAVLQTLKSEADVLWVGSEGGMEADLVQRAGVSFTAIPAAGVHGVGLNALPGNIYRLLRGFREAKRVLRDFRPEVMFFTGGYVAVPVALAGRSVPSLLFVPDIEPGLALRFLSRIADHLAVTTVEANRHFPEQAPISVTGYPIRPELGAWTREAGRDALGLSPDLPLLLVFGGSQGARSINRALITVLVDLLTDMEIVHLSGDFDWPEVEAARAALPPDLAPRYHAFAYLHEKMGAALAAADLVVSRAGGSTLGEFPHFGLPAILVPYPYAWRYQQVNAEYLARHGAALVLEDRRLANTLAETVRELMRDRDRRERMGAAMNALAFPGAAERIGELLKDLITRLNG